MSNHHLPDEAGGIRGFFRSGFRLPLEVEGQPEQDALNDPECDQDISVPDQRAFLVIVPVRATAIDQIVHPRREQSRPPDFRGVAPTLREDHLVFAQEGFLFRRRVPILVPRGPFGEPQLLRGPVRLLASLPQPTRVGRPLDEQSLVAQGDLVRLRRRSFGHADHPGRGQGSGHIIHRLRRGRDLSQGRPRSRHRLEELAARCLADEREHDPPRDL